MAELPAAAPLLFHRAVNATGRRRAAVVPFLLPSCCVCCCPAMVASLSRVLAVSNPMQVMRRLRRRWPAACTGLSWRAPRRRPSWASGEAAEHGSFCRCVPACAAALLPGFGTPCLPHVCASLPSVPLLRSPDLVTHLAPLQVAGGHGAQGRGGSPADSDAAGCSTAAVASWGRAGAWRC